MSAHIQPMAELNQRATQALVREVGVVDAIRFINQFRAGHGNYTAERREDLAGMSVQDIIAQIKTHKS